MDEFGHLGIKFTEDGCGSGKGNGLAWEKE